MRDEKEVIRGGIVDVFKRIRPGEKLDEAWLDKITDRVLWDVREGEGPLGVQVAVSMLFLDSFEGKERHFVLEGLQQSMQLWVESELNMLAMKIYKASAELSRMQLKPDMVALHARKIIPSTMTFFLGLRLEITNGPEKVLSSPEFGRYVLISG